MFVVNGRLPESCDAADADGICLGRLAPDTRADVEACLAADRKRFMTVGRRWIQRVK